MKREILFRGKRVDNGEWVYGAFVPDALESERGLDGLDGFIRRYRPDKGKMETLEVDRETVGQYTGLTDKNGVKIFEGDVLNSRDGDKYVVEWLDVEVGFVLVYPTGKSHTSFWILGSRQLEVIGNIHDHPELLKGESQ